MHPKFLVLFLIISIHLPAFLCQTKSGTTTYDSLSCEGGEINCGTLRYISYPFWGGHRQSHCGRTGFELVCNVQDNVPMLNISSLSYRVLDIDFPSNTLKVARQDLFNNPCPEILRNTTMDPALFNYLPQYKDNNLTLYFNCTSDHPDVPGQFSCGGATEYINLFRAGPAGPGSGTTCQDHIYVPVTEATAQKLHDPIASSINQLLSALAEGFSIQWVPDEKQLKAPFCNHNVYGRSCTPSSNATRTCANKYNCARVGDSAVDVSSGVPQQYGQGINPSLLVKNKMMINSTLFCYY